MATGGVYPHFDRPNESEKRKIIKECEQCGGRCVAINKDTVIICTECHYEEPINNKEVEHTPGPWEVNLNGPSDFPVVIKPGYSAIAEVYDVEGSLDAAVANARLIASAPDMALEIERLRAVNAKLIELSKKCLDMARPMVPISGFKGCWKELEEIISKWSK